MPLNFGTYSTSDAIAAVYRCCPTTRFKHIIIISVFHAHIYCTLSVHSPATSMQSIIMVTMHDDVMQVTVSSVACMLGYLGGAVSRESVQLPIK